MFTGIVEELGTVQALRRNGRVAALEVACAAVLTGTRVGDSLSVNGCCVTVSALAPDGFSADLMGETLDRTALGGLTQGAHVNLERAVRADGRLGGHLVQGHVDGVGVVAAIKPRTGWTLVTYTLPAALGRYVVEKGSIVVDGASLTVVAVDGTAFQVGLVPHTLTTTTLGQRQRGDRVNLEVDVLAKYVERLLAAGVAGAG